MSSNRFNDFIRRAQGAISNFRNGGAGFFIGRNGEVIYSKNNICLHEDAENTADFIRSVSPRPLALNENNSNIENKNLITRLSCSNREIGDSEEEGELSTIEEKVKEEQYFDSNSSTIRLIETDLEENEAVGLGQRPITLLQSEGQLASFRGFLAKKIFLKLLSLPSINLIPNTPIEQETEGKIGEDRLTESSGATSGEDELVEDDEEEADNDVSSCDDKSDEDEKEQNPHHSESFCQNFASLFFDSIPEHIARDHNLIWMKGDNEENEEEEEGTSNILALTRDKVIFQSKKNEEEKILNDQNNKETTTKKLASLFSVNLGFN
uniref:Uncharacterized protein n=1 Tax=Meloidogyne hapla TaxID=6305 RepID=A0A1I8BMJ9_MELHA